jgi:hypothetical protein
MTENAQSSSLGYQPAVKGYSFHARKEQPKPAPEPKPTPRQEQKSTEQKTTETTNPLLLLTLEIGGLVAAFVIFLLILNFFNILSLSSIYPKTFGFLPHLKQTVQKTINNQQTQNQTPQAMPNSQSRVPVNFVKLQNQAPDSLMFKYQNRVAGFTKPTLQDTAANSYISDAVFSGYDTRSIQIVTADGILNLSYDETTLFQKQPDPKTQASGAQSGALPAAIAYTNSADFFKNVSFGSTLQILFSKPNLKAAQVNYIESITPIL